MSNIDDPYIGDSYVQMTDPVLADGQVQKSLEYVI